MSTRDSSSNHQLARHPIRVVSERTGLSPDLLRAWESRYAVVRPDRSEGGHRLYSDADIERLSLLNRVTSSGRTIGQVAGLSTSQLADLAREDDEARARAQGEALEHSPEALAASTIDDALDAVRRLDPDRLDRILRRAALTLGTIAYLQHVAAPFLREIGRLWHEGSLRPTHEHLASVGVRRVLDWLVGNAGRGNGRPRVVIATPAGEYHEMGALLAAAAAESAGWEAIYLGPNLPADEIAQAAVWTGARAVALSAVYAPEKSALTAEIQDVRNRLAPSVTLMLGGRAAVGAEGGTANGRILPIQNIPEFVRILEGLDASRVR